MLHQSAIFVLSSSIALAGSQYTVVPIQTPSPFANFIPAGLNDSGVLVGTLITNLSRRRAATGTASNIVPVPSPPGYLSPTLGVSINNTGQIGGNEQLDTVFIGTAASASEVPLLPDCIGAQIYGMNDLGQVVGSCSTLSTSYLFVGTVAGSTVLPLPTGWRPTAINNAGQIAGATTNQAFIATTSGATTLVPMPSGWIASGASSLNNSGQITGSGRPGSSHQAFIGTVAGSTAIPLPPNATGASGVWINDHGVVVGTSDAGEWIWDAVNGTRLLNDLVPSSLGVHNVTSINNNGVILATVTTFFQTTWVELVPATDSTCTYSITPTSFVRTSAGGGGDFWLLAPDACNWTISPNVSWLRLIAAPAPVAPSSPIFASGSGSGIIEFGADANPGPSSRQGTISAAGLTLTVNEGPSAPLAPVLFAPTNGASGVSTSPQLTWADIPDAFSYDIYFGTTSQPGLIGNSSLFFVFQLPQPLAPNQTYYWAVAAKNNIGSTISPVFSFTTRNSTCTFDVSPSAVLVGSAGGTGAFNVVTQPDCAWSATTVPWFLSFSGGGTGSTSLTFNADVNPGLARMGSILFEGNRTLNVMEGGQPSNQLFNDVSPSDPYFDYVSLMSTNGITAGCSTTPALYCPGTPVTRAQMSVFIVAAINRALGTSLTYTQTPYFQDVPSTSTYFPFVQRIKDLGITAGCSTTPALFCPDESISEGQMAVFMIVGWMLENNLSTFTYTTTPYFTDVQPGDSYFKFVQKMRDLGIWTGCSQTLYCESSAVTRDQMAPMIMRSLLGAP